MGVFKITYEIFVGKSDGERHLEDHSEGTVTLKLTLNKENARVPTSLHRLRKWISSAATVLFRTSLARKPAAGVCVSLSFVP
jgi:hypothetical protein